MMAKSKCRRFWFSAAVLTLVLFLAAPLFVSHAFSETWIDSASDFGYDERYSNYNITSPEELAMIAKLVNIDGLTLEGKIFSITENLDLSGRKWVPIGTKINPFKGVIKGAGESGVTISNLSIVGSYIDCGLVGYMENASIVKLTLEGSINVSYAMNVGSAVGFAKDDCSIADITNRVAINVTDGTSASVGGIVGMAGGVVGNVRNDGTVTANGSSASVGGIVGSAQQFGSRLTVSDAVNNGSVTLSDATEDSFVGGIIGSSSSILDLIIRAESSENPMKNTALISAKGKNVAIGGIVGGISASTSYDMPKNAVNEGNISATDAEKVCAGALVGAVLQDFEFRFNFANSADMEVKTETADCKSVYAGFLAGYIDGNATIESDYENSNSITVGVTAADTQTDSAVGNLLGMVSGDLSIYYDISSSKTETLTVNSPELSNLSVGGFTGFVGGRLSISSSSLVKNESKISVTCCDKAYVGGIVGKVAEYVDNNDSRNLEMNADIDVTATSSGFVGGFFGQIAGDGTSLEGLNFENKITVDYTGEGKSAVGGIIGSLDGSATVSNVSFTGKVYDTSGGMTYAGGIVGYAENSGAIFEDVTVGGAEDDGTLVSGAGYVGGMFSYFGGKITNASAQYVTVSSDTGKGFVGGAFGSTTETAEVGTEELPVIIDNVKVETHKSDDGSVGGACGYNLSSKIHFSTTAVDVTASEFYRTFIGGVIGQNKALLTNENLVKTESISLIVNGDNAHIGGAVGYNKNDLTGISIKGIVIDSIGATHEIGGLVGRNEKETSAVIKDCEVKNLDISSEASPADIGGIAGYTDANIEVSYVYADEYSYIDFEGMQSNVGGIVGFATGADITGTEISGGIRIENIESLIINVKETADESRVGGVCGYSLTSAIVDFFGKDIIINTYGNDCIVGGFAGLNKGTATKRIMASSIHDISITAFDGADNGIYGGIVGKNLSRDDGSDGYGKASAVSTVENTHIRGKITVNSDNNCVGGSVGHNGSVLSNNSITDSIVLSVYGSENTAGGLVGKNNGKIWFAYSNTAMTVVSDETVTGGLVGENNGEISASYIDSKLGTTISGTASSYGFTGGLVGKNTATGIIDNCYVNTSVVGGGVYHCVGGFAGCNIGAISDSYTAGSVKSDGATVYAGGFLGRMESGSVSDCYSAMLIDFANSGSKGGFAGRYDSANDELFTKCYYLKDESLGINHGIQDFGDVSNAELLNPPALNSITDSQLKDEGYFKDLSGWDFDGVWKYGSQIGAYLYPELTVISATEQSTDNYNINWYTANMDAPLFKIGTAAELAGFAKLVNGNVSGYPEFDFEGRTVEVSAKINLQSAQWEPIGIDGKEFAGTFDGKDNLISGLMVSPMKNSGLFGVISEIATVKNTSIEPVSVKGEAGDIVGALASVNKGTVLNCDISLTKSAEVGGGSINGGIVGKNDGSLSGCTVTVDGEAAIYSDVTGAIVGGAIGENTTDTVTDVTVNITNGSVGVNADSATLGGIIGVELKDISELSITLGEGSLIKLSGENGKMGGIIGEMRSGVGENLEIIISDGKLVSDGAKTKLGGIVGVSLSDNTLKGLSVKSVRSDANTTPDIILTSGSFGGAVGEKTGKLTNGIFDLDGVTVEGITVSANNNSADSTYGGVVGLAENTVMRSVLSDVSITANGEAPYVGGVVASAKECVIYKAQTKPIIDVTVNSTSTGRVYVGGIVGSIEAHNAFSIPFDTSFMQKAYKGINDSSVSECTVNVTDASSEKDVAYVGGAVGYMNGAYACFIDVEADIATDGFAEANVGGMLGKALSSRIVDGNVLPKIHTENALLSYVGGFVGTATQTNFDYDLVSENGEITVGNAVGGAPKTRVGGFIGEMNGNFAENCSTAADVTVSCNNRYNIIYSGGFAGNAIEGAQIKKSFATANVTVTADKDSFSGGFVGYADETDISECYAKGNVLNEAYNARSGGFVGSTSPNAEISFAYAIDSVVKAGRGGENAASSAYAGGFAGYNNGAISDVYADCSEIKATAISDAADYTGAISGYNYDLGTIARAYCDSDSISVEQNNNATAGALDITNATLSDREALTAWNFASNNALWTYIDGVNSDRPVLTNVDNHTVSQNADFLRTLPYGNTEYVVTSGEELAFIERMYNDNDFKALYNMTDTPFPIPTLITLADDIDLTGKTWNPINDFTGEIIGDGFTIKGLYRYAPSYIGFGLVSVNNGDISNLTVENADVNVGDSSGLITNVNNGEIWEITVKASEISASGNYIGGIAGKNNENGEISDINIVSFTKPVTAQNYAGGIVGISMGVLKNITLGDVAVNVRENCAGGVCGMAETPITNVTAEKITVSGNIYIGGIAGKAQADIIGITVNGKLAALGSTFIGGVVGETSGSVAVAKLSDVEVTATNNFVGGVAGNTIGEDKTISLGSSGAITVSGNDAVGGVVGYSCGEIVKAVTGDITVTANSNAGGIVGRIDKEKPISNITVNGKIKVTGDALLGGIVGLTNGSVTVTKLSDVEVIATNENAGGIAGMAIGAKEISIDEAKNITVSGTDNIGGVVGITQSEIAKANITGTVTVTSANNGGGIAGGTIADIKAISVGGKITVNGTSTLGGIVGNTVGNVEVTKLSDVEVNATDANVGGIVGLATGAKAISLDEAKSITVSGTDNIGGVAGLAESEITRANITGTVTVTSANNGGGIAGRISADIKEISVGGKITVNGVSIIGGIVGNTSGNVEVAKLSDIEVNATDVNVGGIAGVATGAKAISLAEAKNITVSGTDNIGGVVGFAGSGITKANITGTVTVTSANNGGGIAGGTSADIKAISVGGKITVNGTSIIGGIVGNTSGNVEVAKLSDIEVNATDVNAGGIAGAANGAKTISLDEAKNVTVSGKNNIGGIVGITQSEITKANIIGTVTVTSENKGGGIASETTADIKGISVGGKITVNGTSTLGGIVGNTAGNVEVEQLSDILVTATGDIAGGIVGVSFNGKSISVASAGNITVNGINNVGGIASGCNGSITKVNAKTVTVSGTSLVTGVAPTSGNISSITLDKLSVSGKTNTYGITADIREAMTVNNITVTEAIVISKDSAALIARTNSGVLSNVKIEKGSISGTDYVSGGVINNDKTIKNIAVNVDIYGGTTAVSGIAFSNNSTGMIESSSFGGKISGSAKTVGGIVCSNSIGAVISDCRFTGSITGGGNTVGGICATNSGTVNKSFAINSIDAKDTANSVIVGGIVGQNLETGSVTECFSSTDLTVSGMEARVGGISGETLGLIKNCYTAGGSIVRADGVSLSFAGGISGYQSKGTIENCIGASQVKATIGNEFVNGKTFFGGIVGKKSIVGDTSFVNNIYDTRLSGTDISYFAVDNNTRKSQSGVCVGKNTEDIASGNVPTGFDSSIWAAESGFMPKLKCFEAETAAKSLSKLARTVPVLDGDIYASENFTASDADGIEWSAPETEAAIDGTSGKLLEKTPATLTVKLGGLSRRITVNSLPHVYTLKAASPTGLLTQTFKDSITIRLTSTEHNAVIYYTLDGQEPTVESRVYTTPITISVGPTTVKAMVVCDVKLQSDTVSAVYSKKVAGQSGAGTTGGGTSVGGGGIATTGGLTTGAPLPVTNISVGTVVRQTKFEITPKQTNSTIYYTLDGTTPTKSSAVYEGAIILKSDTTVKFFEVGAKTSEVVTRFVNVTSNTVAIVEAAASTRYIAPESSTEFKPDSNITRYDVVESLNNLLKFTLLGDVATELSDVSADMTEKVAYFQSAGIINGYTDGTFRGGKGLTRAEFVKIMSVVLGLEIKPSESTFSDVKGHWAEDYVAEFAKLGYIKGYTDGSFKPDKKMTRAEFTAIVNRIIKADVKAASPIFTDVTENHWAYADIMTAYNSKVTEK